MRFQLLGPLSVTDGADAVVLPPSKPTILLAVLLLHANSVVSAEHLQRAVWGEARPATAKAALQTCVLRLRRLLPRHGVTETPIEAVPGGYRITAGAKTLDLLGFRDAVRQAAASPHAPEAELSTLKEGLSLWQGPLLANVRSDTLHRDEVPRLAEERLRAVERVCDLELALGRCGEALAELWAVTRAHPGHERFHEQLMEALYRTGRQAEALAEYRRVKEYLREELGVDPSPTLRRLELAILRGEELAPAADGAGRGHPRSGPVVRVEREPAGGGTPGRTAGMDTTPPAAALAAAPPPPAALPARPADRRPAPAAATSEPPGTPAVPSFTGRAAEVGTMVESLTRYAEHGGEPPLILLCGAPGIGKSALARHVAQLLRAAFPGGPLLVPMTDPDGAPREPADAAAALTAGLRERGDRERTLLILDDVADAAQVRPLLPAGAGGAAVVTSRMGLAGLVATHGGRVHRLSVFGEDESYRLLCAVLGAERVEAEPEAARRLADVCGHHPLALRIMTARLLTRPGLRLADAAGWLAGDPIGRLSLADSPGMSVPEVFGGALGRLDPRLAEAFLRLGSLPGGTFRAGDGAPALGMTGAEAEAVLERLADAGLLEEGPPGPYRMHPLLHLFAREAATRTRPTEKV
ncbi:MULTISPECIES: AfsR/SARP family transcriptional regulator [Streptomyces]|uniref:AfsR family transcriptional regulator n=4 Tax=Streptomyces TaxID=1883 RepID=A0A3R7ENN7_9ACTN|nr:MULTISPECIES: BTAD domain-containing putative transcriptional regulator [Streptomyces]KNE79241.1 AfsR family transcriptional regulator [Streptomyces fradiae]PQM21064.1 AfsR family transcriptional regulator [Streptomyces xinghaiensis]RKM92917.1 AfsR family transcriptional regulator [Streptomyces xinghaiensis]RNC72505.1 AfsR family transcriptional regulator [Streptomyces xinghaiensis]